MSWTFRTESGTSQKSGQSSWIIGDGQANGSKEYVYKLAESVRDLYPAVKDDYLFELEVSP